MPSTARKRQVRDFVRRHLTDFEESKGRSIAIAAVVVSVLAAALAPDVRSRSDVDDMAAVFGGLLACMVGIVVVYAVVAKRRNASVRGWAMLVAVAGLAAAVAGLLQIPHEAYKWAFAVAVGALVYEILVVLFE